MKYILDKEGVCRLLRELPFDEPVDQGVNAVAKEIQNKRRDIEKDPSLDKVGRLILLGEHDPDTHREHKGVRYGKIAAKDHIPHEIRNVLLVMRLMRAEHIDDVTDDHRNDRHDL